MEESGEEERWTLGEAGWGLERRGGTHAMSSAGVPRLGVRRGNAVLRGMWGGSCTGDGGQGVAWLDGPGTSSHEAWWGASGCRVVPLQEWGREAVV